MIKSKVRLLSDEDLLVIPEFDFLESVDKMIYSEIYHQFFAFKVRDIQEMKGDHLCFVIQDRDLLAQFMIFISESYGYETNFEMNEEFSILKDDLTPIWFSFSDLHKKLKN